MIENILTKQIAEILDEIYGDNIYDIQFQKTRKEFEGDITLVVFPFTRFSKIWETCLRPLKTFSINCNG